LGRRPQWLLVSHRRIAGLGFTHDQLIEKGERWEWLTKTGANRLGRKDVSERLPRDLPRTGEQDNWLADPGPIRAWRNPRGWSIGRQRLGGWRLGEPTNGQNRRSSPAWAGRYRTIGRLHSQLARTLGKLRGNLVGAEPSDRLGRGH
jgi:hypothetical protein